MKKFIIAAMALLFLFNSPLHAQGGKAKSDKARKNLEMANIVNQALMNGDMSLVDKVIAKDAVDHAGMHGDVVGLDSIKAELNRFRTMLPDMKIEMIREMADDEYTMQWLRYTGTTAANEMGMPAGTKMDMTAVEVTKFRDGKAVEHWSFLQPSDMMKMMQHHQGMGADKMMDSGMQK